MRKDFRLDRWIVQPSLNRIRSAADTGRASGTTLDSGAAESRTLGHKVMSVLVCLAERPGELVTREELLEHVWEGAFTTDEALATVVYELRKTLDDDARRPRYVETIRKRGYRLIAPVSSAIGDASPVPAGGTPVTSRDGGRRWPLRAALATAVSVAAVFAVAALLPGTRSATTDAPAPHRAPPAEPQTIRSLAVRPLSSFTEECRQDFFAGGLTEMLIADLVYLGPFDVIPTPDVDGSIRADAIVEGSVLRSGDRLWISIQLVDGAGGQILWGGTYERELHDSLDLQQELSREITHQIVSNVTSP